VLIAAMCNQAAGAVTIRRSTHQAQFTRAITPLSTLYHWNQERHQGQEEVPPRRLHCRVPLFGIHHRGDFTHNISSVPEPRSVLVNFTFASSSAVVIAEGMVLADADPINRMSWRSTRRPGQASDDEDRESVMLGGVRLRGGDDDNAPLALEDPWWSKLTGMPSSWPVHEPAHSGCTCARRVGPSALFMHVLPVRLFLAGQSRERGKIGVPRFAASPWLAMVMVECMEGRVRDDPSS